MDSLRWRFGGLGEANPLERFEAWKAPASPARARSSSSITDTSCFATQLQFIDEPGRGPGCSREILRTSVIEAKVLVMS